MILKNNVISNRYMYCFVLVHMEGIEVIMLCKNVVLGFLSFFFFSLEALALKPGSHILFRQKGITSPFSFMLNIDVKIAVPF